MAEPRTKKQCLQPITVDLPWLSSSLPSGRRLVLIEHTIDENATTESSGHRGAAEPDEALITSLRGTTEDGKDGKQVRGVMINLG
jgi:hypothetical protein